MLRDFKNAGTYWGDGTRRKFRARREGWRNERRIGRGGGLGERSEESLCYKGTEVLREGSSWAGKLPALPNCGSQLGTGEKSAGGASKASNVRP